MKKYQSILVGALMLFTGAVIATITQPSDPQWPMPSIEQSNTYMDKCMEMGGWHASSGYVSADRIQHICYGIVGGREVPLDVTYLTELPS